MKNLRVALTIILSLCYTIASAETVNYNGLTHNLVNDDKKCGNKVCFKDINDDASLSKRKIYKIVNGKAVEQLKINGDIETIGATISIPEGNDGQGKGYKYKPNTETLYTGSVAVNVQFVREDDRYKFNSSKATFNFSEKKDLKGNSIDSQITGDKVIFARLYWGGGIAKRSNYRDAQGIRKLYFDTIKDFNKITFGAPGNKYYKIEAERNDVKWYGSYMSSRDGTHSGLQFVYQASADVTDIVKQTLGKTPESRTFSAGDIVSSSGMPQGHDAWRDESWIGGLIPPHMGGWALVIVYDLETSSVQPKSVSIYDGLKILAPIRPINLGSEPSESAPGAYKVESRKDSTILPFSGFYTPLEGKFKSSLTVLSFGAKVETKSEDIEIETKDSSGANIFKSVNDGSINEKGGQFNSTISRFGKHMNTSKEYNNQMDLDIYDISNHMNNRQTSTNVKLTAKVLAITDKKGSRYPRVIGERANIGLVAFSTDAYVPKVCYIEKLFVKGKDETDDKFIEVGKSNDTRSIVKKDSVLKVQLTIKNPTNESAEFLSITSDINPDSMKYKDNSTYIYPYDAGGSNNFKLGSHNEDDQKLQKKVGNNLQFFIGKGANNGTGGTLEKNDQAFIQYETTLNKDFLETKYRAKLSNKSLNLEYEGTIDKCKEYKYYISIFDIDSVKVVNENFTKKGSEETLYTQLNGEKFDVKLAYLDTSLSDGSAPVAPKEKVKVASLEVVTNCSSPTSILNLLKSENGQTNSYEFDKNKAVIEIKDISIKDTYPALFFRVTYIDPATKSIMPAVCSDPFSVRPKEFKLYDTSRGAILNANDVNRLIGGRNYPDIGLVAIDNGNNIATNYSNVLETDATKGDELEFIPLAPESNTNCVIDPGTLATINVDQLRATFTNGKSNMEKFIRGAAYKDRNYKNFSYLNVGRVQLKVTDASYTAVDHSAGDCITGSDSTTKQRGKIGCNTTSQFTLNFLPHDIAVDSFRISNFANGMTYMNGDPASSSMAANAKFNITARLHSDAGSIPATLYKRGCYSNNIALEMDINKAIEDLSTKLDGTALNTEVDKLAQARSDIIYFNNSSDDINKTDTNALNSGKFNFSRGLFQNGIAAAQINFNFARNIQVSRNPFRVTDSHFEFSNISDDNTIRKTPGAAYTAPSTATDNVDFYYGRVYAPKGKGSKKGFEHKVYFGVYCNACDTDKYVIAKSADLFPDQANWFANAYHDDASMGQVDNYEPNSPSTKALVKTPVKDGIEKIFLSSSIPGSDTIKMKASSWLLFNEADKNAKTNNFIVEFTDGAVWGGQSLSKDGKNNAGVGSVVGGSKLDDISNQTNRRLEW